MSTTTTTTKLTKAEFARVHAKEYHAKRRVNGGGAQLSTTTTDASGDPVAAALNCITASNETSYDAFVRSFGETEFIQRRDEEGQNELTVKQKQQSQQLLTQIVNASSSSSTAPLVNTATLPPFPATSSPTTLSSSSDFLTLMRLLAEDKERLKGNTHLITGDEQEDERNQATSNRSNSSTNTITPATAAAWQGDHIRVDDSYGFTADPFAPEAVTGAGAQPTESDDDEEEAARVRVLGDDEDDHTETSERKSKMEDEDDEDDDPTQPSRSDRLESGLFLSEEDAGASLESVPVEAEYQYQADKDNLSLEQFRATRDQSTPQTEEITTESAPPLVTPAQSLADSASTRSNFSSSSTASTGPPSFSARSASRLEADAIATARQSQQLCTDSVLDEVETFHYQPDSIVEQAEREEKEEETNEISAVQMALQSALALQRASQLITPAAPHASTTTATTHRITTISSSQPSLSTSATRPISTVPPSAFNSSLGDDSDVDDVELVDLDDEISTSVPILAKVTTITSASTSTSTTSITHPPKSKVGNFLDLKDQLGFESDDERQPEDDEEDEEEAS